MRRLIFGCGYLGWPTAGRWLEAGDTVFGVTRQPERFTEFQAAGVQPILADVTDLSSLADLPVVDTVLVAVGMDRSIYSDLREVYVRGLLKVLQSLPSETGQLIYVSSTGVYGDFEGGWVDEESATHPTREGGRACLEAESLIRHSRFSERATILRFAGIYGPQRVPMRQAVAAQEWEKLPSEGHLNLIHVADGARVIQQIAAQQTTGETINVTDGRPTLRKAFYETVADLVGSGPIDWPAVTQTPPRGRNDKRIVNEKLRRLMGSDFLYPDFRVGLREALKS